MKKIYALVILFSYLFTQGVQAQGGVDCIDALLGYAGSYKVPSGGNCLVTMCVAVAGNPRPKQIQFELTSPAVASVALCVDGSTHAVPYDCGSGSSTFADGTYCYTFTLAGACPTTVNGVVRGYTNASGGSGGLCVPAATYTNIVLPVRLTSFTFQESREGIKLEWSTSEEVNSNRFEVQRSKDAISFQTVGTIISQGNSSVLQKYHFTDSQPTPGYNYYRLLMVDNDNSSKFSHIIAVKYLPKGDIEVAPNPASVNDIYVNTKGFKVESVKLISVVGREIPIQIRTSDERLQIVPTKNLLKGIYFITLDTELGVQNHKVIIE